MPMKITMTWTNENIHRLKLNVFNLVRAENTWDTSLPKYLWRCEYTEKNVEWDLLKKKLGNNFHTQIPSKFNRIFSSKVYIPTSVKFNQEILVKFTSKFLFSWVNFTHSPSAKFTLRLPLHLLTNFSKKYYFFSKPLIGWI